MYSASFFNSIANHFPFITVIVIKGHHNALSNRSNELQKQFWQFLSVEGEINTVNFTISSHWKVILHGSSYMQIDEYTRKAIPALRNIISNLQGNFIRSSWRIS